VEFEEGIREDKIKCLKNVKFFLPPNCLNFRSLNVLSS